MGALLDGFDKIAKQSLELIKIRDRKIALQAAEIAMLKKLLDGFKNATDRDVAHRQP